MRAHARLLIALALLLGAAAAALLLYRQDAPQDAATDALFAASFTDATGQLQPLSQWRGRVLVVNFWATWCPPCRDEMPELAALQDKLRTRGLTVVGISTDDAAKMQEFARESPVSYSLLAADFEAMALAEGLGNDKGILPYTVVLDRAGRRVHQHFGRIDARRLEADVLALLGPAP